MKKILILGCTGSIGTSTLDIIRKMSNRFHVVGLSANKNEKKLSALADEFNCPVTLTSRDGDVGIANLIDKCEPDIVVNGIAGSAGLLPSKSVLERGIDLALANKETIVMAAPLVQVLAETKGCRILPVDSEHSAIFNLIDRFGKENVSQIVLTASGGPFRCLPDEKLDTVTPSDALKHPTWNMGSKITIDSASLANKGLEVIEACRLFHVAPDEVQVVVHPESLIHSLVRTKDGMLYAQISNPDMKHPILSALCYPEYTENFMQKFDLFDRTMTFFHPRFDDFPLLGYAYEAAEKNASYTVAYNAADEVAALAFLAEKIKFTDIQKIVRTVLDMDWTEIPDSFEAVFEQDKKARKAAEDLI